MRQPPKQFLQVYTGSSYVHQQIIIVTDKMLTLSRAGANKSSWPGAEFNESSQT